MPGTWSAGVPPVHQLQALERHLSSSYAVIPYKVSSYKVSVLHSVYPERSEGPAFDPLLTCHPLLSCILSEAETCFSPRQDALFAFTFDCRCPTLRFLKGGIPHRRPLGLCPRITNYLPFSHFEMYFLNIKRALTADLRCGSCRGPSTSPLMRFALDRLRSG